MKIRIAFACTLLTVQALAQTPSPSPDASEDSPYDDIQVLARALQLVRQEYVDESQTSYRDLVYSALRGMLAELDPHSQFMSPDAFKGMQEDTRGEFGGLGIVVSSQDGLLTIVSPMEDTPGFEAGLLPGDQILNINGKSTEKISLGEAVEMLRGSAGDSVTLTISRPATREIRDYTITRRVIKVASVKDAQLLPEDVTGGKKIGYVRLTQFNEPTAGELQNALIKLEKKGMEGLILDLRYNPGGLLGSAVDVSGLFLPPGTKVVSTEGRNATGGRDYVTTNPSGRKRTYPVAVLINYASASGSEIVAGALKDLKRAILVGEKTFGKGSVQSVMSLQDGSALRLTTQKYYTPSKNPIHEVGISPHIRAGMSNAEEAELLRVRRQGGTEVSFPEGEIDSQLHRAIDALCASMLYAKKEKEAKKVGG